jgi:hypothetical protein
MWEENEVSKYVVYFFFGKFCADIFFGMMEVTNNCFKCDTTYVV